jgi:hypothetical protein
MAVFKIYPDKDTTLYSLDPLKNTGRDEILEVSARNSRDYTRYLGEVPIQESPYYNYNLLGVVDKQSGKTEPFEDIARSVLSFSNTDVAKLKSLESGSYKAVLKAYLAFAQNLAQDYTLECAPLTQPWVQGTGTFPDTIRNQTGASWKYTGASAITPEWSSESGSMSYLFVSGGGSWNESKLLSQSFHYNSSKDINLDLTPILQDWFDGDENYGIILKHADTVENNTGSFVDLKFFSANSQTVFKPHLEFRWNDTSFLPPSGSEFITDPNFRVILVNNLGTYKQDTSVVMRVVARDQYPVRKFTTTSNYLQNKFLDRHTTWAIQDYRTEDMVIDFDQEYTRLGADIKGHYFKIYTQGLEPERYYKILIKTRLYDTAVGPLALLSEAQLYEFLRSADDSEFENLSYTERIVDENYIFRIER